MPAPESLLTALSWVDLAIFCEVQRVRARGRALGKDSPWGAYIGEGEVDEILGDLLDVGPFRLEDEQLDELRSLLATRRTEAAAATREGPLAWLSSSFELTDDDLDLLLLALAPEVNARYLRLFGYLQDDFNAQHLTPSLALRLLRDDRPGRLALGSRLTPDAPLLRHRLLLIADDDVPMQVSRMQIAPRIGRWLLQGELADPDLHPWARLETGDELAPARPGVANAVEGLLSALQDARDPVIRLRSRSRRDLFEAARDTARRLGSPLLVADLAAAERLGIQAESTATALAREARLQRAVLLVLDPPKDEDRDPLAPLLLATQGSRRPLLLQASANSDPLGLGRRHLTLDLPGLPLAERRAAWQRALATLRESGPDTHAWDGLDPDVLARRYRYTPGQIDQVLELAADRAATQGASLPSAEDIQASCADAFLPDPGPLAVRAPVRRGWDDLVLPDETHRMLQEILGQVERREQVLEALGEARVRPGERGIKALFAGPPGTGKTLSAEVLAHTLGYPLFRVDLASVVSKYVGETEKQLGRLFTAAEEAPCVLLFDEADALFGKRAEVKGAQDRFANLEVSYLLQRLEAFDGVAILTSNIKRNIDEAFLRRFTFVLDFPFPEASERLRIWKRVLTEQFPLAEDVPVEALAAEFKLAGANIWNVAVAAAVSAAGTAEKRITRGMLAHAVRREYQKMGREVAALKPTLLAGASEENDGPISKAEARRRGLGAPSAAQVRRSREQALQDERGAGPSSGAAPEPTPVPTPEPTPEAAPEAAPRRGPKRRAPSAAEARRLREARNVPPPSPDKS